MDGMIDVNIKWLPYEGPRIELGAHDIRCTVFSPSAVATELVGHQALLGQ